MRPSPNYSRRVSCGLRESLKKLSPAEMRERAINYRVMAESTRREHQGRAPTDGSPAG